MKIAINPGHFPGLDPGACGNFMEEADVAHNVAKIVCEKLQSLGHETVFIQYNELYEISGAATESGADIFVSIHCNAADSAQAHGTETFYYPDAPSEKLADCVQQCMVETLGTTDRGCKDGSWIAVLNGSEVEATVLVELAFISNAREEALLAYQQEDCAAAIVAGITKYIDDQELMEDD